MKLTLDIFASEDDERLFVRIGNNLYEIVEEKGKKVLRQYAWVNPDGNCGKWGCGGWAGTYEHLKQNITGE